jgi:hypothetical protein
MAGDGDLGNNLSTSPISQAKGPDDYDEDPDNDPGINKFLWPWSHPPPDQPGHRLDWLAEALMDAADIIPLARRSSSLVWTCRVDHVPAE